MAEKTVNVPIIGKTNKATLFIAGLAGVVALGYAYYKNKKTQEAQAAATASTPTTGAASPYGYAYGYGAYEYEPYGYGYGPFGLGAYGGEGMYGYGYYGAGEPVNEEVPAAATTNAQWVQAAMTVLNSTGGYGYGSTVLTALGLYVTGSPVSANQASIIQAAIGAEGYPPQSGATGYPPNINTSPTTGQSGTTPATGSQGYGQAGPSQTGMTAITQSQAATLLSQANTYNPSGKKSQRPFVWNGTAYVPATVIIPGYQYYAGPLETTEITKKAG